MIFKLLYSRWLGFDIFFIEIFISSRLVPVVSIVSVKRALICSVIVIDVQPKEAKVSR